MKNLGLLCVLSSYIPLTDLISCMVSWLLTLLIYIPSINNASDVISYLPFKMAYSSWVIRREKMKGGRGIHVTGRMTVM